ncbi:MAG: ornithine cyclodeaminase family protein [bacterium]|nr:ornithine cyclodeaminase family protein [bacterium]
MTRVVRWDEIDSALARVDVVAEIERGFVAYSRGECVVPPVGELIFDEPPGEVHIKYGYVRGEEHYVVKVASGFYGNAKLGLPSGQGMMILFRQATGEPVLVLLDEGRLTDERTAAAGAAAARLLAPPEIEAIGIFGTGIQARLQLAYLRDVVACRRVLAWGRNADRLAVYARDARELGFDVEEVSDPDRVARESQLIVTTTAAKAALFGSDTVQRGTHVTAVGSDTPGKQELPSQLLGRADLVVADSLAQCRERGEIASAPELSEDRVVELGHVAAGDHPGRTTNTAVTVADLTGVAVQDLRIAEAVLRGLID